MKIILILLTLFVSAFAKGTLAGEQIINKAEINVNIGGTNYTIKSNTDKFVVDQIVDINVKWQDAVPIDVASGEKQRVLTYILKNEGNGKDTVGLSSEVNATSAFIPENSKIYVDSNKDGVFNSEDELVTNLDLNADESLTLFIVSDIPDGNFTANDKASEILKATSSKSDTEIEDSQDSVDVVIRDKEDSDSGIYIIRDYYLESIKSKKIISEDGVAHTGTIIRYKIELFIGGNTSDKEINNIDFKDLITNDSEYVEGSLKLDDESLSDKVDSDSGSIKDNIVNVHIDSIKADKKTVITFDVKIK